MTTITAVTNVTAQKVLHIAANEIGYRETGKNNNKFGIWYGMNHEPWCAMFVSYCFYKAGLPLPAETSKGFASCRNGVNYFKNKGWWRTTPQVGDVVFYNWHDGDNPFDHVGIVEKVNPDGSIVAIEGNYKDQVMRVTRSGNIIIGYGRPPYGVPSVPPIWPGRYIALTSPNMKGDDVLVWQQQMIQRGWNLTVDSVFSEQDHEVLIKFQREKGLEVDGKIGPKSWNAAWESPITPD